MGNVIFALPRTEYGSYQDMYSLIDLSGFDKCYIDEIDRDSDNAYIITVRNGELGVGWEGARASIYLYDIEYRREPPPPIPGVKEVWHMDATQAAFIGAKYVPIGGHPGLRLTDMPTTPQYDVTYLAYMTYRRQHIYSELSQRGVRLSPTSAWGEERDAILNNSRKYAHIHQWDDIPAVPGLRLVVAAAYRLPVVTETCADPGVFGDYLCQFSYADYAHSVAMLKDDSGLEQSGLELHELLCERLTFRTSVENAL